MLTLEDRILRLEILSKVIRFEDIPKEMKDLEYISLLRTGGCSIWEAVYNSVDKYFKDKEKS